MRLRGPQSRYGSLENKTPLSLPGIETIVEKLMLIKICYYTSDVQHSPKLEQQEN
jgi:hypothetical protein